MMPGADDQVCGTCTGPLTCPTCATLSEIERLVRRIDARLELERTQQHW